MNNTRNKNSGFSLIEILVVIGIIILFTVSAVVLYRSFASETNLTGTATQIVNVLELASNRTLASENDTNYGVHFAADRYVLFPGTSYNPSSPGNEVNELPDDLEIYSINLNGGGSDIIFSRLTGTTTHYGTIILRLVNDTAKTKTITILSSGQAGLADSANPADTRIADSRHTHFDLGWSLRGAATLTLTFNDFPNPDTVQNVTMSGYFDPGQTEFDWEGSVTVGGAIQTVRVHTHSLDASDTILCIHRDGRVNNKALTISIDGKQIASYTADGDAAVGAFGGTMEIQ